MPFDRKEDFYSPMPAGDWTVGYKKDDPDRMAIYFQTEFGVFGFEMAAADAEELAKRIQLRCEQARWAMRKSS